MTQSAEPIQLNVETLLAFQEYVGRAEAAIDKTAELESEFLWCEAEPKRAEQVRRAKTIAEYWSGSRPIRVPDGLIHDWIGTTFAPGASVQNAIAVVQDYDNHKNVYKPEVLESRLINRAGDDFEVYLRLRKKKIRTVVLDTYHEAHYVPLDPNRWQLRSHTTRISEVEHAGEPKERVGAPDTGHGFLWRLNSYWRFFEKDNGVYLECRAISLTRNVPKGLAYLIEPFIKKLPQESLIATLEATRSALP